MNGIPRAFRGVLSTKTPDSRHGDIFRFVHRARKVRRMSKQHVRTTQRVTRIR